LFVHNYYISIVKEAIRLMKITLEFIHGTKQ